MRKLLAGFALTAALALPVAAQEAEMAHTDPVTAIQPVQGMFMGWVTSAAEQVAEADYAYQPTSTVRTFGQLFGHVANSNYMICAIARGEDNPSKDVDFEKSNKAEIVAGLKASAAYCSEVAKWGAEHHHDAVTLFGMKGDVTFAMAFNASHNAEHYGNIVTYMRMKGMVPPSSQGGM
jgi:uncharacterized damage-inducible protein DinB